MDNVSIIPLTVTVWVASNNRLHTMINGNLADKADKPRMRYENSVSLA